MPTKIKTEKYHIMETDVKTWLQMNRDDKVNLTPAYQRGDIEAWHKDKKMSPFIATIFDRLPLPVFHMNNKTEELPAKIEDTNLDAIDGQQRTRALLRIYNDLYISSKDAPQMPERLKGKSFSQWNDEDRATFLTYRLHFFVYDNLSNSESSEYFSRINSGIAKLSDKQALRGKMLDNLIKIENLANHPALLAIEKMKRDDRESVIIQLAQSLTQEDPNPETVYQWFTDAKINQATLDIIKGKLDNLSTVLHVTGEDDIYFPAVKRMIARTSIEAILYAITSKKDANLISLQRDRLIAFFGLVGKERNEGRIDYQSTITANTGKAGSLTLRHKILRLVTAGIEYKREEKKPTSTTPANPPATPTTPPTGQPTGQATTPDSQPTTPTTPPAGNAPITPADEMNADLTKMSVPISKFKANESKQNGKPEDPQK